MDILNNIDHQFLQSGFIKRTEFYPTHLNYVNAWCEHWHIRLKRHMKMNYGYPLINEGDMMLYRMGMIGLLDGL